jgi:hypothetical protein
MARGGIEPPTREIAGLSTFIECSELTLDQSVTKVSLNKLPKGRRDRIGLELRFH